MLHLVRARRSVSAVLLCFALIGCEPDACAGWLPTPEARMACCADEASCPMHKSGAGGTARTITQAEADSCCLDSESGDPAPSQPVVTLAVTLGLAAGPIASLVAESDARAFDPRAPLPTPATHVPRHVLLSVFLV